MKYSEADSAHFAMCASAEQGHAIVVTIRDENKLLANGNSVGMASAVRANIIFPLPNRWTCLSNAQKRWRRGMSNIKNIN